MPSEAIRGNNQYIQQLIDAEQRGKEIVQRARENRNLKLKEAKVAAEEDVKRFRQREEERFRKEFEDKYGDNDAATQELEETTRREIDLVKQDFKNNKDAVIKYLLQAAANYKLELTDVQKRYIRDHAAGRM